jgi:NAD(P)-dependent dehydrogenase (short-subunit alcohol dehydrogenase family)
VTSRTERKGEEAVKVIDTPGGVPVQVVEMELDSLDSVRRGAAKFLNKARGLNVLICNAGVMMCPEGRTKDGFETQFGVNHLSHFLLFQLLKDTLISSSAPEFPSRVVSLASCAHRGGPVRLHDYNFDKDPYDSGLAYGQSKTANIYFASEIERRCGIHGVHGLSVHPGLIQTPLLRHIKDNPMAQDFIDNPETNQLWKSPEQGAATEVWAAVGKECIGLGGRYLEDCSEGKPFDPKSMFPGHAPGYASYAYDQVAAEKLWEDSLAMVAKP